MKAIAYYASLPINDENSLQDIDLPEPVAGPRDLLVEVKAISVNPVDTKVRQNVAPENGAAKVLGWDVAGVVKAIGSEVTLFKAGDKVFYAGSLVCPGGNSELHTVDERIVGHMPKTLGFAEAAALPLTAITAWELLFERLQVREGKQDEGQSLLIVGAAGGVGSILTQLASQLTALKVIGTASRPQTQAWAKALGADLVIDHSQPLSEALKQSRPRASDPRRELDPDRPPPGPTGRSAAAPRQAGPDRRPQGAGCEQTQAQEPVAALGVHVHPVDVRNTGHDRAAQPAQPRGRTDRRRHLENYAG